MQNTNIAHRENSFVSTGNQFHPAPESIKIIIWKQQAEGKSVKYLRPEISLKYN